EGRPTTASPPLSLDGGQGGADIPSPLPLGEGQGEGLSPAPNEPAAAAPQNEPNTPVEPQSTSDPATTSDWNAADYSDSPEPLIRNLVSLHAQLSAMAEAALAAEAVERLEYAPALAG